VHGGLLVSLLLVLTLAGLAEFGVAPVTGAAAGRAADPTPRWAVDLATASAWELMLLPGIGASRAHAILSQRTRTDGRSPATWEDLLAVPGIGRGIVDRLRSPGMPVRVLWRGRPLPTMGP